MQWDKQSVGETWKRPIGAVYTHPSDRLSVRLCMFSIARSFGPRSRCDRWVVIKRMRVELRDSESFEQLLRRFTKGIERSGIIREHRRGLRFVSVQEENRAKRRKAERRRRRNQS